MGVRIMTCVPVYGMLRLGEREGTQALPVGYTTYLNVK